MAAYYNEIEPFAAQWLRNLIAAGHIAPGDVDERSIVEVQPDDLRDYDQCHFFAGIAGWSLALRMAMWPDARPVWTGSCPCQPFSAAGKQRGEADERHLWPEFRRLIAGCRPATVFGEQVASALGRDWLAAVRTDLENLDYGVGAADLCAAGVGAPHIRQRLWWVADADRERHDGQHALLRQGAAGWIATRVPEIARSGGAVGQADSISAGLEGRDARSMGQQCAAVERGGEVGKLGHAASDQQRGARQSDASMRWQSAPGGPGPWSDLAWLPCRDGKARPTQPGLLPLAHGIPGRVGRLRAYGNAIVPQVAAQFIGAVMECRP